MLYYRLYRTEGQAAAFFEQGQDRILGFKHGSGILDQIDQETKRFRKAGKLIPLPQSGLRSQVQHQGQDTV